MAETLSNFIQNDFQGNTEETATLTDFLEQEQYKQAYNTFINRYDPKYIENMQNAQKEIFESGSNIQEGTSPIMKFGTGVYGAVPSVALSPLFHSLFAILLNNPPFST